MCKYALLALTFLKPFVVLYAQPFTLPPLQSLYASVDSFYASLAAAQSQELRLSQKHRWLSYLPSPGYSPFAGGFTLSLNLSAPLQEVRTRQQLKLKQASIYQLAALEATTLRHDVAATHQSISHSIQQYYAKDSLQTLKEKLLALYTAQYRRAELTPSQFLQHLQEAEAFSLQRMAEANSIRNAILQLLIKAKAAVATNYSGH